MSFSELDRTYIRKFLRFSAIFLQGDPRLESAITGIQSISDGGSRPDSNGENAIKALIYGAAAQSGTTGVVLGPSSVSSSTLSVPARKGLLDIQSAIDGLIPISYVLKADNEAEVDPVRGRGLLMRMRRALVQEMEDLLSTPSRGPGVDPESAAMGEVAVGIGGHNGGGESSGFP